MHIELVHLTKHFGGVAALDDVTLTIDPGQIVAVVGANGAGKTTLLRCLAGIAASTQGEVRYDGQLFRRDRIDLRRRFAFLADVPFVYPDMTVLGHIAMALRLYEVERTGIESAVLEWLRELDLLPLAETRLNRLSRGQKYKAALAALLAVDPEVWMFDEPFASGMDPHGLTAFRRHAREAAGRGRTVIYTTQLLELAERFSDRVLVLYRGRRRAFDAVDVLRQPGTDDEGVLEGIFAELREENP
ncbi:MAG TPA: ABC transporter ATP-binding protein [Pirellulales bacterium]|nr:ABC transporter ATP-binding protein [Pirellulales bacterium]